jgi:hypothetical protein
MTVSSYRPRASVRHPCAANTPAQATLANGSVGRMLTRNLEYRRWSLAGKMKIQATAMSLEVAVVAQLELNAAGHVGVDDEGYPVVRLFVTDMATDGRAFDPAWFDHRRTQTGRMDVLSWDMVKPVDEEEEVETLAEMYVRVCHDLLVFLGRE